MLSLKRKHESPPNGRDDDNGFKAAIAENERAVRSLLDQVDDLRGYDPTPVGLPSQLLLEAIKKHLPVHGYCAECQRILATLKP